ncbi:MAG TPA: 1-deoxy-D-xylulose-5-phosphate reductoisomerase [Burkholderiales bacterium]|nr:1-deoxy-D-xylulose-5-phosphate reductoisomerase [Burkholderiales bacterium]
MQRLAVLGSTGSIGVNTLAVAAMHPDRFRVDALAANRDVDRLFAQCMEFRPRWAVMADETAASRLRERVRAASLQCEVLGGAAALEQIAAHPEVDAVMAAIVGAAGLRSTLAAAAAGKKVLLANKEAMVMAGPLVMAAVRETGATLLPIDSEHNAIFQALPAHYAQEPARAGIRRLLLTGSGGPFRNLPTEKFAFVTPQQACAHPNWVMGRKISVDSATLMNKGLEVIEAAFLFNVKPEQIEVVIHPQSVVHSLVEYVDGSVIAQLGNPDMRTPIAHALAFPERVENGVAPLDLFAVATLQFERPDLSRFPCLGLAYAALQAGAGAPVILNAANEVAVASFLDGRLSFSRIAVLVEEVLAQMPRMRAGSLQEILAADTEARRVAREWLAAAVH